MSSSRMSSASSDATDGIENYRLFSEPTGDVRHFIDTNFKYRNEAAERTFVELKYANGPKAIVTLAVCDKERENEEIMKRKNNKVHIYPFYKISFCARELVAVNMEVAPCPLSADIYEYRKVTFVLSNCSVPLHVFASAALADEIVMWAERVIAKNVIA